MKKQKNKQSYLLRNLLTFTLVMAMFFSVFLSSGGSIFATTGGEGDSGNSPTEIIEPNSETPVSTDEPEPVVTIVPTVSPEVYPTEVPTEIENEILVEHDASYDLLVWMNDVQLYDISGTIRNLKWYYSLDADSQALLLTDTHWGSNGLDILYGQIDSYESHIGEFYTRFASIDETSLYYDFLKNFNESFIYNDEALAEFRAIKKQTRVIEVLDTNFGEYIGTTDEGTAYYKASEEMVKAILPNRGVASVSQIAAVGPLVTGRYPVDFVGAYSGATETIVYPGAAIQADDRLADLHIKVTPYNATIIFYDMTGGYATAYLHSLGGPTRVDVETWFTDSITGAIVDMPVIAGTNGATNEENGTYDIEGIQVRDAQAIFIEAPASGFQYASLNTDPSWGKVFFSNTPTDGTSNSNIDVDWIPYSSTHTNYSVIVGWGGANLDGSLFRITLNNGGVIVPNKEITGIVENSTIILEGTEVDERNEIVIDDNVGTDTGMYLVDAEVVVSGYCDTGFIANSLIVDGNPVDISNSSSYKFDLTFTDSDNHEVEFKCTPTVLTKETTGYNGGLVSNFNGEEVFRNDILTYSFNDIPSVPSATSVYMDVLSEHVEFVSASDSGIYDADSHTVIWILDNVYNTTVVDSVNITTVEAHSFSVDVKVITTDFTIIENSIQSTYVDGEGSPIDERESNIVDNIVNPIKMVKGINGVFVDDDSLNHQWIMANDELTYMVSRPTFDVALDSAYVVITDKLDENVTFISTTNGGVYDEANHTVTWTFLSDIELDEGLVDTEGNPVVLPEGMKLSDVATDLLIHVKVGALSDVAIIRNDATYTYYNLFGDEVLDKTTPEVTNPFPIVKRELSLVDNNGNTIFDSEGLFVQSGYNIVYSVSVLNPLDEVATLKVTDYLDSQVAFISTGSNGTYDSRAHSVTWLFTNVEPGGIRVVDIVVKVSNGAKDKVVNIAHLDVFDASGEFVDGIDSEVIVNPIPKPKPPILVILETSIKNTPPMVFVGLGVGLLILGYYGFDMVLKNKKKRNTTIDSDDDSEE